MPGELFWRMNTEKTVEDKPMGEKHAPVITIPSEIKAGEPFKVRVSVGGGKHPNQNEHHIQWVELRIEGLIVGRAEFSPVVMDPEVEFTLHCPNRPFSEISAVARCNMHGLWESKVPCNVKA